jgi:hypothetical protein
VFQSSPLVVRCRLREGRSIACWGSLDSELLSESDCTQPKSLDWVVPDAPPRTTGRIGLHSCRQYPAVAMRSCFVHRPF